MKKSVLVGCFILVVVICNISMIYSYPDMGYLISEPIFNKALTYYDIGSYNAAIKEFKSIIREHSNSPYAATAQLWIAKLYYLKNQPEKGQQEFQSVIDNYPGTQFWLKAKISLTDDEHRLDIWLPQISQILTEAGGLSVYSILKGDYQNYDSSVIPLQYREAVADEYCFISVYLNSKQQLNNALKILYFLREKFPGYSKYNVSRDIGERILASKNITNYSNYPQDNQPPQITIDSPHHGKRVHGLKPRIQVDLQDGDIMAAQVNLSKLIFTLDGEDVTDKMKVQSKINTSAQPGVTFEKIRLTYKPESPLAVGTHTVYVKAEDYGGRSSEKTWTFTIVKPELYRDGDDEDN